MLHSRKVTLQRLQLQRTNTKLFVDSLNLGCAHNVCEGRRCERSLRIHFPSQAHKHLRGLIRSHQRCALAEVVVTISMSA